MYDINCNDLLKKLLQSVINEQERLSELLKVEILKIYKALCCTDCDDLCVLIKTNDSVANMIKQITGLQLALLETLKSIKELKKIC